MFYIFSCLFFHICLETEEKTKEDTALNTGKEKDSLPFDDPVCITLEYFRYELYHCLVLLCFSEVLTDFLFTYRKRRNFMEKEVRIVFVTADHYIHVFDDKQRPRAIFRNFKKIIFYSFVSRYDQNIVDRIRIISLSLKQ